MNTFHSIDNQLVRDEQIKGILEQSPTNIVTNLSVAVLAYWGFNSLSDYNSSTAYPILWLLLVLSLSILQLITIKQFQGKRLFKGRNKELLLLGSIVVAFITGIAWSLFVIIFFNDTGNLVYLLAALVCGMIAGSIVSTAIYLPLYFLFSLPFIATFIVLLIQSDLEQLRLLSLFMMVYYGLCANMAFILNKRTLESFHLRFSNNNMLEKLQDQKLIAEQANIAKSKFLAAASHDLRQPLHALGFFIDALKVSPEKNVQLFDKIEASITSLKDMFDALLDISKLDAGIIFVNKVHFKISPVLDLLKDEYEQKAREKDLQLNITYEDQVLYSDPELLKRILGNLLSNSIRYTEKGTISLSISQSEDQKTIITIADTGIGIPENEIINVYDEFYQLNNPERDRRKGLGLGLAIVKKLSNLLEVEMTLTSIANEGTVFCLVIDSGEAEEIIEDIQPVSYQNKSLQGKNILMVDDEIDVRQALEFSLTGWGCNFLGAASLEDAIEKVMEQDFRYDLIISDLRLRDNENGVDTIDGIMKKTKRVTPALLITGDTSPEQIMVVSKCGHRLLHKPLKPAELRLNLINLLEAEK